MRTVGQVLHILLGLFVVILTAGLFLYLAADASSHITGVLGKVEIWIIAAVCAVVTLGIIDGRTSILSGLHRKRYEHESDNSYTRRSSS